MAKSERAFLSAAVACLLATAAWAEKPRVSDDVGEAPTGLVGERVRLSGRPFATSDSPLIGRVATVDAEAITVIKNERTGETIRVPLSSIKRLDVARPEMRSNVVPGVIIGVLIPAAAALWVGSTRSSHGGGELSDLGRAVAVFYVVVLGVPVGALAGGIVGGHIHSRVDRWERVPIRRVQVSVLPDFHGGIRGGITVRF